MLSLNFRTRKFHTTRHLSGQILAQITCMLAASVFENAVVNLMHAGPVYIIGGTRGFLGTRWMDLGKGTLVLCCLFLVCHLCARFTCRQVCKDLVPEHRSDAHDDRWWASFAYGRAFCCRGTCIFAETSPRRKLKRVESQNGAMRRGLIVCTTGRRNRLTLRRRDDSKVGRKSILAYSRKRDASDRKQIVKRCTRT